MTKLERMKLRLKEIQDDFPCPLVDKTDVVWFISVIQAAFDWAEDKRRATGYDNALAKEILHGHGPNCARNLR